MSANITITPAVQPAVLLMEQRVPLMQGLPQPLEGFSEQNEALDRKKQEAGARMFHLVFEVGLKIGKAIQTLQAEKLQLEFANRALENEITLLKSVHAAELSAAVDSHTAKIMMVIERMKSIVEKLALYKKKFEGHHFSDTDILLFSTLQKNISKVSFEDLKHYPEYCDSRKDKVRLQEQTVISPLSEALILRQSEHNSLIEKPMRECEVLASEIAPLRAANLTLLDKKEMMIDFYGKYLAQINREKVEPRLKKILELVRSTYSRVQWEKLVKANPGIYSLRGLDPYDIAYYTQLHQDTLNKKMRKIQEAMKVIISTLETFVNPQPIRGII